METPERSLLLLFHALQTDCDPDAWSVLDSDGNHIADCCDEESARILAGRLNSPNDAAEALSWARTYIDDPSGALSKLRTLELIDEAIGAIRFAGYLPD